MYNHEVKNKREVVKKVVVEDEATEVENIKNLVNIITLNKGEFASLHNNRERSGFRAAKIYK